MNIYKALNITLASAALAVAATGASFAQGNLTPGGTITPTATTLGGALITSQTDAFTSALKTYSGSLYSAVYNEGAANSLGGLTFVYQLQNDAMSKDALDRIAGGDFSAYQSSAFYSTQAGGLGAGTNAPNFAFETLSGGAGFKFDTSSNGNLFKGQTSDVLIVRTNANSFTDTLEGVSDNTTVNVASYTPATTSVVPEPATVVPFAFGALGLLALGLRARKTRRTSGAAA